MSVNIFLLAKKVSGKEADIRVHVRTRVVQIQRRRPGIRSVVVTRTHDRQALNDLSPPEIISRLFCWFLSANLSSRRVAFRFRITFQKSAYNAFHQ